MSGKTWGIVAVMAIVLAQTGCVSCCHKGYQQAREHGPECDLPSPCRNEVHVFLIHGVTPSTSTGLDALQTKLGENGFAKVGVGELAAGLEIVSEIKMIRACDPEAKFVLIGYDFGGGAALCIAHDLYAKKIPLAAVGLLDPLACGEPCGARTLLITSGTTTSSAACTDRVTVPDATHFRLPTHPTTVTAITDLLKEVAIHNWQPAGDPVPAWTYPNAPEMYPPVAGKLSEEWNFLSDRPGMVPSIGTRTVSQPAPAPQPAATSAGPVVVKP